MPSRLIRSKSGRLDTSDKKGRHARTRMANNSARGSQRVSCEPARCFQEAARRPLPSSHFVNASKNTSTISSKYKTPCTTFFNVFSRFVFFAAVLESCSAGCSRASGRGEGQHRSSHGPGAPDTSLSFSPSRALHEFYFGSTRYKRHNIDAAPAHT